MKYQNFKLFYVILRKITYFYAPLYTIVYITNLGRTSHVFIDKL